MNYLMPWSGFLKRFYLFILERELGLRCGGWERDKPAWHWEQSPVQGLISQPWDHGLSQTKNQRLNQLSHSGVPFVRHLKKNIATCMKLKKLQDITKILCHHYVRIELNKKIKSSIIIPLSYEILKRTMYTQWSLFPSHSLLNYH